MTRRALLPCAALAVRSAKAAPRARVESLQVISQQPEFYHGWPTLTRRRSDELLVTYSGGREAHVCPFGRVKIIRSFDNPRRWSPWMLRSTDGGLTWSARYRVPVNSPHGPVAASGGRLLYAGKKLWDTGRKVGLCESTDDGVTWRWLSNIPARAGDAIAEYHELHAVEAGDGWIVVQIRNHNAANAGETLQCESSDGGHSWNAPRPIGVWGMPSHFAASSGWPPAHDVRLSARAVRKPGANQRGPRPELVRSIGDLE